MRPETKTVFLHTGYRTAGTWLWSCFRRLNEVTAYYEPLHEMLSTIDSAKLATSTADSWRSGHPKLEKPYFAEFAHLLEPSGQGISGYEERFSIDRFSGQTPDGAGQLQAYLCKLISAAHERGGVPVFKFCRSLGRLPWFRSTFPDAVHIVVEKNPISQWRSCWDLLATHGNPHFVAVPFAVLALNRDTPVVEQMLEGLHIDLPRISRESTEKPFGACLDFFKQHVMNVAPADAYRAFLAHWLLASQHATTHADAIFDCDLAARSPAYTRAAERWVADLTGLEPSFGSARQTCEDNRHCGFEAPEGLEIHLEAVDLGKEMVRGGAVHPDTFALWTSKLAQATQVLAFGAQANWPQTWTPLHRATRIVDIALIDGAGVDTVLAGELAATRAALGEARQQLARLQRSPFRRLTESVRGLYSPKRSARSFADG
ncbi:hypothetical protein [Paraburkholderia susongensis]|uniref:Sulfotransferase family protein n=1 Tax=Paraburkholderia susongensis TaxID=1515439 RepID=A0A1X7JHW1_9BURK|nr:hypothetical protein [Paraburkholderia susongensis]SMG26858.1 hypothetical protein SAMN06265784_102588 [Paraburkholderia susongensis]